MTPLQATCDASLLLLVLFAAWSDARTGLIPNFATLGLLSSVPLAHLVWGGPGAFLWSMFAALACALVPLWLFWQRAMGGGDVKLFAAIGALAGVRAGIEIQWLAYVLGAVLAVLGLWQRGLLARTLRRALLRLIRPFARGSSFDEAGEPEHPTQRLGVPVLLSCLWVLGSRWLLQGGAQ